MTRTFTIAACLTTSLILALASNSLGQAPPSAPEAATTTKDAKSEPNWEAMCAVDNHLYLANLNRVRQEYERLQKHPFWGEAMLQLLGTEYSYIGRYQKALELFDRTAANRAKFAQKPGQLTSAARYEPRDGVDAILELADKHQVIMINEAHHVPMHRAFTLHLLEGLYQKGFRYFCAETLKAGDKSLQTRGYPTIQTGGYTTEPVYADLVRTALKLGYTVTAYECEDSPGLSATDDNRVPAINIREQGQARNLKERILDKDPSAKIIVHAGYGHICKKPQGGKQGEMRWMAVAFQDLTGIEPFSIDQTEMSEANKPENEKPDYRFAVENHLVADWPVVLHDKEAQNYFVSSAKSHMYDLSVVHPRTRYENGRPTWLSLGGRRTPHTVQTDLRPPSGSSYLAQAFLKKEMSPEAIPIDQMDYNADEPLPTLWLPTGKMHIRIVDDSAKVLHEYTSGD